MDSPFMEQIAVGLAENGIYITRFEFPYMKQIRQTGKRKPPDSLLTLKNTWIEVIKTLGEPRDMIIGGKSMGGRIASLIADELHVRGLVCLGYPFHPPGRPDKTRIEHLHALETPTLILQGKRDTFGNWEDLKGYSLSKSIELIFLEDGDHSFKPRKKSGYTLEENIARGIEKITEFCLRL